METINDERAYFQERTMRNRNVITAEEQEKFRDGVIGIAGLSVGSSILMAIVQSGGPKKIKIADFDVVEVSNLNRMRATISDLGVSKTEVAARQVKSLDPFAELTLFEKGLTADNLEDFLNGLDVFIDEMDSIDLKIAAREICKKRGISVVMATDNGDGAIVDVERFDQEPGRAIFHGRLEGVDIKENWLTVANAIIGEEYLTERMKSSLKHGPPVPQLGTGAGIAGSCVAYVVRMMLTDQPMKSGKYIISPENIFA